MRFYQLQNRLILILANSKDFKVKYLILEASTTFIVLNGSRLFNQFRIFCCVPETSVVYAIVHTNTISYEINRPWCVVLFYHKGDFYIYECHTTRSYWSESLSLIRRYGSMVTEPNGVRKSMSSAWNTYACQIIIFEK